MYLRINLHDNAMATSLVPDVKGQDQALCRRGDKIPSVDFEVGGKKKRKFTRKILPYNVWCILIGKGRLV